MSEDTLTQQQVKGNKRGFLKREDYTIQPSRFSGWFRTYDDIIDDPKILRLSDKLKWFWHGCLCLANRNNGYLPDLEDVAVKLRRRPKEAQSMIATLIERNLLDQHEDGKISPHNWFGRQFRSDNSTERVDRYRERTRSNGLVIGAYLKYRDQIFERDGGACVYCGSEKQLCIDHMMPISRGGSDDPRNLCTACKRCNCAKSGRTPSEVGFQFLVKATEEDYLSYLQEFSVTVTDSDLSRRSVTPEADTEADTDIAAAAEVAVVLPPAAEKTPPPPYPEVRVSPEVQHPTVVPVPAPELSLRRAEIAAACAPLAERLGSPLDVGLIGTVLQELGPAPVEYLAERVHQRGRDARSLGILLQLAQDARALWEQEQTRKRKPPAPQLLLMPADEFQQLDRNIAEMERDWPEGDRPQGIRQILVENMRRRQSLMQGRAERSA